MFAFISGKLASKEANSVVLNCGGVGFSLLTTYHTIGKLPELGEDCTLHTYLSVREDALELFGFADREELACYKMLITVSGVGPRVGLAILSELTPERFALAVVSDDTKALTKASGVGPKLAGRIILELKDKVAKSSPHLSETSENALVSEAGQNNVQEAIKALVVLGYSANEARVALQKQDAGLSVETLIRQALKLLM